MSLNILLIIIFFIIFFETLLFFSIQSLKKEFKWLINSDDEKPKFEKEKLKKFYRESFDKDLGWDRKKNSSGVELNENGKSYFSINNNGSRGKSIYKKNKISVFGDSYAFCRYVDDNQTWEYFLEKKIKANVLNFGVGNFGIDQSFLKILKIKDSLLSKIIIINVVPETISRINSMWKHYLEFGNYFGFKPIYQIKDKKLKLIKIPIKRNFKKKDIYNNIDYFKENDFFYKNKFLKYKYKFPYLFTFFKHPYRNFKLLILVILSKYFKKKNKLKSNEFYLKAFGIIVDENIKFSHKLYNNQYSKLLLEKIIEFYSDFLNKKKKKLLIVITPQLFDLKNHNTSNYYQNFFKKLQNKFDILDLSNEFKKGSFHKYYTSDKYGGHLSLKGNLLVSKLLFKYLNKKKYI